MSKVTSPDKMTLAGFKAVALGALASRKVLLSGFISAQSGGGTLININVQMHVLNPDGADGPFIVGIATGALSATEIESALENQGPSGPAHSAQTEVSTRWRHIRKLGWLFSTGQPETNQTYVANFQGKFTPMGWAEQDGGYQYWIYNVGNDLVTGSTWNVDEANFVIMDRD